MTEQEKQNLAKAHSAASHMAKMRKAVTSFHSTVGKLSKAHHDDMQESIGQLHKVLGVMEEGGGAGGDGPAAENITSSGSTNLQDFGKMAKALAEAGYTVAEPEKVVPITKADVAAAVAAGQQTLIDALLKATGVKKEMEDVKKGGKCEDCGKDMEDCKCAAKVGKATGVGDRTQVQEPVRTAGTPVLKTGESNMPTLQTPTGVAQTGSSAEREEMVRKAAAGDQTAALELMKGARPAALPTTLTEALSKIH